MYDPITLLAAHPLTLQTFFEVDIRRVGGVDHIVVGLTDEQHGLRDPHRLRAFLMNALYYGLAESVDVVRQRELSQIREVEDEQYSFDCDELSEDRDWSSRNSFIQA